EHLLLLCYGHRLAVELRSLHVRRKAPQALIYFPECIARRAVYLSVLQAHCRRREIKRALPLLPPTFDFKAGDLHLRMVSQRHGNGLVFVEAEGILPVGW